MRLEFTIPGVPSPGGSKKAFFNKGMKFPSIVDAGGEKTKHWRAVVALAARNAYRGEPLRVPVRMRVTFYMPRPKNHYRANGQLKPNAPVVHISKPDSLKLCRSTEDAMTGIVYADDSLIFSQTPEKFYANQGTGAKIVIEYGEEYGPKGEKIPQYGQPNLIA